MTNLSFATTPAKANCVLALMKKSFIHIKSDKFYVIIFTYSYKTLVYGNIMWGPHYLLDQ